MKRIMVYGDSITWGRRPGTTERYDRRTRFTGVIANTLGENYEVVEEGLRARMLCGENPNFKNRDGFKQFGPIFGSHVPLDLVVIMLGTNDTNADSDKSAKEILSNYGKYRDEVDKWSAELMTNKPKLLLVSPPPIIEENTGNDPMFAGAEQKTRDMPAILEQVASEMDAYFFDSSIVSGGELEGIHIDESAHKKLGENLATSILEILESNE